MGSAPRISGWERFRQLSGRDQWLLVEAWFRLAGAAIRVRLEPRRTLADALAGSTATARSSGPSSEAASIALAVGRAAAHHLRPMTCLPRSLALRKMLAKRGIPSTLRIGVRKDGATLAAHAWVEVAGTPLGEPTEIESRFLPLVVADRGGGGA